MPADTFRELKMQKSDFCRILITLALAAAILSACQSGGHGPGVPPVIRQNDGDGDGRLNQSEFPGPPQAFQRLDTNGDGYLSAGEFHAARDARDASRPPPPAAKARGGPLRYTDVHMYLHPLGLDVTMGGAARPHGPIDIYDNLSKAADILIARMDRRRIKTALIVVVPSFRGEPERSYQQMHDIVADHRGRLALMAGGAILGRMMRATKPGAVTGAVKREFQKAARELLAAGAAGFGKMMAYHLCMNPKHSFQQVVPDHPLYLSLADIAAENDVPIDIHMEAIERAAPVSPRLARVCKQNPDRLAPNIAAFERLLRHNAKARIVWQHIGWDNTGQMTPELLGRLLAAHANLYLALRVPARVAGIDGRPIPNRLVDAEYKLKADWLRLFQAFPDRFVIGSDEFVGPSGEKPRIAASFDTSWALLDQLPEALAEKIGGENARRIYRLD